MDGHRDQLINPGIMCLETSSVNFVKCNIGYKWVEKKRIAGRCCMGNKRFNRDGASS